MNIVNRTFKILEEKKIAQKEIAEKLKVNPNVLSAWKKRETDPPAKYIIPLCEILEASPEYLFTGKEKTNDFDLSKNETDLLHYFRKLVEDRAGIEDTASQDVKIS